MSLIQTNNKNSDTIKSNNDLAMEKELSKRLNSEVLFRLFKTLCLITLFSGLISIAFLDSNYFYFAWFAFVPLLFAIDKVNLKKTYLIGLIAGLLAYFSGTYWILDFIAIAKQNNQSSNIGIAFIYWLYCAHQFILMLLLLNWLRAKTLLHDFILFPIIVTSLSFAYPMLFPMRLGESQFGFFIALQATEFLGVHSLDMIIALSNIMIFHLLRHLLPTQVFNSEKSNPIQSSNANSSPNATSSQNPSPSPSPSQNFRAKLPWLVGIMIITLWFVYGHYANNHWHQKIKKWDTIKIGLVQPNEVPSLGSKSLYPGYSRAFPPELEMTNRLASLGAEITIWPEAQTKEYLNNVNVSQSFQSNIKQFNTSLIFQDLRHIKSRKNGNTIDRFNAAIMINNMGQQKAIYKKIKRIPFGEYIPLFEPGSWLHQSMQSFLGEFLTPYSKGSQHQVFKHKQINMIPLICYETTFPEFVAAAVNAATSNFVSNNSASSNPSSPKISVQKAVIEKANLLVALSNDGWFGSTHQPYQHIMASVLRAVENRIPLIHVANNGPSIVVTPDGQIIFTSDFQKAAGYLVDIPYSKTSQGSFYSRHPNLLTRSLSILMTLLILTALVRAIITKYNKHPSSI
jgi:apolipoprotein N-acyltransferase